MTEFSAILYVHELPQLDEMAYRLQALCDADGCPAQAGQIRRAYIALLTELERGAILLADEATKLTVEMELQTRVRPSPSGSDGPHMADHFISEPISALPGSVGVNNEDVLNQEVPWWITNEQGSSANVGREEPGWFFGPGFSGPSRPDPTQSRVHPLFAPSASGPPMTIKNPIPARRFVERAYLAIAPQWHDFVRAARHKLEAEWNIAMDQHDAILRQGRRRAP